MVLTLETDMATVTEEAIQDGQQGHYVYVVKDSQGRAPAGDAGPHGRG